MRLYQETSGFSKHLRLTQSLQRRTPAAVPPAVREGSEGVKKLEDHQIDVANLSRTYGARSAGRLCLLGWGPPLHSRGCAAVAANRLASVVSSK
jgi:hypothetical protein